MHAQPVIPPVRNAKQMWQIQAFVWTAKINTHFLPNPMKISQNVKLVQIIVIDALQIPSAPFVQLDTISKLLMAQSVVLLAQLLDVMIARMRPIALLVMKDII